MFFSHNKSVGTMFWFVFSAKHLRRSLLQEVSQGSDMGGAQAVENDAMPCAAEIKQKVLSSSEVGILPANVSIDSCIAAYISLWKSECNFSFRDWAICGGGTLP